jgi:hypothetical protein
MLPRLQSAHGFTSSSDQRRVLLMPRFYCDRPLENGLLLSVPDSIARHVQVLRLKTGDMVTLFNGSGGEYTGTLTTIEKKNVEVMLKTFSAREAEPAHAITLAQGLPEGAKMDWIVEKAVELGVTGIQPLMCSRSVVRLDEERAAKKVAHWQGIMAAAAEWIGDVKIVEAQHKRWRMATPQTIWPQRLWASERLVFAGDAFGGPRIEGAVLSGRAAARHLLTS